jgi:hypothetical protein
MLGKRQFSLGYLFLLIFCWALALAATRQSWIHVKDGEQFPFIWILAAGLAWCAAIAGAFFNFPYGLKLAKWVLPMWACLLVLGNAFGGPLRNLLLIAVLMSSSATVLLADAIWDFLKRQRDKTANQK